MGNKGMTLLETIVSILILSIAGLIFISGFTTVLNTFQKAESVKNQSDAVYSAIHQGGSASVKKKGKKISYTISGNGKAVTVSPTLMRYYMAQEDVSLSVISDEVLKTLSTYEEYKTLVINANALVNFAEDVYFPDSQYNSSNMTWNGFSKYYEKLTGWKQFPKQLLPKPLQQSGKSYYIRPISPWNKTVDQNKRQSIFYLSTDNQFYPGSFQNGSSELLSVIYDLDNKRWYYDPSMQMTLTYRFVDDYSFYADIDRNGVVFKSYGELMSYIRKPENGWLMLDEEAEFDGSDTDSIWL